MLIIDIVHCNEPYATRVGFCTLLSILVLLHYFWYMQVLIIGYNMRRTGKIRDISETVEHPADKAARAKSGAPPTGGPGSAAVAASYANGSSSSSSTGSIGNNANVSVVSAGLASPISRGQRKRL